MGRSWLRRLRGRAWFPAVASALVAAVLRLLGLTWRLRFEGESPLVGERPVIGALWHRGLLAAAWAFRSPRVAVPVSLSRDGDLTAAVLARLGFAPSPRGSSSRGAPGLLRAMIRAGRQGLSIGVLSDGPRGPARRAKPGILAVARATGLPIHPVAVSARPCLRLGSWDRALLPLPFAEVVVAYGEPLLVPKSTGAEELETLRRRLESELDRLTDDLDARLGLALQGEQGS
jgi:hypothetical protein